MSSGTQGRAETRSAPVAVADGAVRRGPARNDGAIDTAKVVVPSAACDDGASVASGRSGVSRISIADVMSRVSDASVVKVAKLHTELQDSVCARRLVVLMLLLALATSVAVAVVTSRYRVTATEETTALLVKSTVATAIAGVRAFFEAKYGVQTVLAYGIDSGWLREPMDQDRYDQIIAPFFVRQNELLALYNAHSSTKNTLKFSAEVEGEFFTESRWYRNDTVQERQRRTRSSTADITTYTEGPMIQRSYDPTLRGWYVLGDSFEPGERGWDGPDVQTTNAAGDLSVPVFSMVFKHPWPAAVGGHSVFRLKFSVEALTSVLVDLDAGPRGNAYVVNEEGEVVGARDPSIISADGDGEFAKIWEINAEPVLRLVTLDVLQTQGDVGDTEQVMAHVRMLDIAGFSLVVVLHADDFLVESREINDLAAILSLVSIVVLVLNLFKMLSGLVMLAAHRYQERKALAAAEERAADRLGLRVGMEASSTREAAAVGATPLPLPATAQGRILGSGGGEEGHDAHEAKQLAPPDDGGSSGEGGSLKPLEWSSSPHMQVDIDPVESPPHAPRVPPAARGQVGAPPSPV